MSNTKKKKKKMEDRISQLPDSLLHLILSSLNTKLVVQTCVLSKRWKTLWIHIPVLNFDCESYSFKGQRNWKEEERWMKHFIFGVLSEHRCPQIQKLSYSTYNNDDVVVIELLICYARCRNVRELCIKTDWQNNFTYDWKHCFSACSSLTVLKITCGFMDNWGELMLPSLKFLEISCEWDWGMEFRGIKMFSGCPNLESLVLTDFCFQSVSICAPKLVNFELCLVCEDWVTFPEVELLAPNLERVWFSNILPTIKFDLEFSCIREVIIEVDDCNFESMDDDGTSRKQAAVNICELLRVFHNASSFTLPMELQVDWSLSSLSGSSFHNLKHLKLKTKETKKNVINLPMTISAFLLKCPNLETMAILQ